MGARLTETSESSRKFSEIYESVFIVLTRCIVIRFWVQLRVTLVVGKGKTRIRTYGWMDGRISGRTDIRTDGRISGRTDIATDGRISGRTDIRTDGRISGWTDGRISGWTKVKRT